jgi:hypothetical protein
VKVLAAILIAAACTSGAADAQVTYSIFIPSSAHAAGANGSFYTTDVIVANPGTKAATFTMTFLGHDQDGTSGPSRMFSLGAGQSTTFADVLGSLFSVTNGYGAIKITSTYDGLFSIAQTSTPGFGGTFGQSVPAEDGGFYAVGMTPATIAGVREDTSFRTNLIVCNMTRAPLDVDVALVGADAASLASKRYTLQPLGMTQVSRVVRDLGVAANTSGVRLDLSTPTANGEFAAYASLIDNVTNDPRTLLPTVAEAYAGGLGWAGVAPSTAHAPGANGAFYTTDLTISNLGSDAAAFSLQFLGHDQPGDSGPIVNLSLSAGRSATYADVLGTVFGQTNAYGAVRVVYLQSNPSPYSRLLVTNQTATPGFGGTFGQSVPADIPFFATQSASVLGVREDPSFRTNLVLYNNLWYPGEIAVSLIAADGTSLGSKRYTLAASEMTQISRVVRDLGVSSDVSGARLLLAPVGAFGTAEFSAYASVIDNVTNDPRTLLALIPPYGREPDPLPR